MLSTVFLRPRRSFRPALAVRLLATETVPSTSAHDLPPPPTKHPSPPKPRTRLYPHPRPASSQQYPTLPPSFGRNQLLPVSNSTRALLQEIVDQFDAPVRYAFAYGSGVFEQDGYAFNSKEGAPMLDFMFAVTHPAHWHSINMQKNPSHYTIHARIFGSAFVSKLEEMGPGVWFNAFVPMQGVTIKYGVTTVDNLCSDLLNWRSLYLAGRMHKPLRIIKDDARVRLTQQVNLTSAIRATLLTLPQGFSEVELFERIAGISYRGDPRMVFPSENRSKVRNIVRKQQPQFKELYHRLVVGLPGVHWPVNGERIEQDITPHARSNHLRKLPRDLLSRVRSHYAESGLPSIEADESAYWIRLAGDENLPKVLEAEMGKIVRYPATIQSLKGVVSAGPIKSIRYSSAKIRKWWNGSSRSD